MRSLRRQRKLDPIEYFWLLLLALFSVSFLNLGGYILVLLLGMFLLLNIRSLEASPLLLLLMFFSGLYFTFYFAYFEPGFTEIFNYLIAPWAAFAVGEIMTRKSGSDRMPYYIIAILVLGLFLHGFLNLIALFAHWGADPYNRVAYDFWRWERISVTANGLYYQMGAGLAFGLLFSNLGRGVKAFALCVLGVVAVNATLLGHRTSLYILIILLAYNLLITLIRSDIPAWRKGRLVAMLLLAACAAVFLLAIDFLGIRTWIVNSSLYQRMTNKGAVNSTERTQIWDAFFSQALYYPLGGCAFPLLTGQSWVHNLWLDVYYKVGVFPFLLLMAVTVAIVLQFQKLIAHHRKTNNMVIVDILLNIYIAFTLACMVEPVIDGNPYVLISFFMINGCVSGILRRKWVAR